MEPSNIIECVDRQLAEKLIDEIERYLDTVAVFRALGHEPGWKREDTCRGTLG